MSEVLNALDVVGWAAGYVFMAVATYSLIRPQLREDDSRFGNFVGCLTLWYILFPILITMMGVFCGREWQDKLKTVKQKKANVPLPLPLRSGLENGLYENEFTRRTLPSDETLSVCGICGSERAYPSRHVRPDLTEKTSLLGQIGS